METLLIYLVNASIGIALFFLVYWLVLRKETFHTTNRWFLMFSLLLAVVLPLIPVQYEVLIEAQTQKPVVQTISDTFKNIPVFAETEETASNFSWQQAVLLVYLTGAAIFLIRLLTQTIVLIHLMIKYRIKSLNGVRIVENEKYGLPFSFFNIIFINPKFHTQDDLPEILAHEKVHIRENHWFDLLLIELLTVIFWFNPFIWLFERAIKQNHEYLADKGVLAQGHTVGRYQALLVNQLMGMQIIGITNNLNFALSTNRLKMMTKKKTSTLRLVRLSWALPVLALLLFAFAKPQYKTNDSGTSETNVLVENKTSGEKLTVKGKVINKETGKPIHGASVVIKGSTIGCVSDKDGKFTLVDPNPEVEEDGGLNTTIVTSFVGLKTVVTQLGGNKKLLEKRKGVINGTIKLEEEIILISTNVPPPPPPPVKGKTEKLVKKGESNIPPPPPKKSKEKLVPPPPPPPSADREKEVFFIVEEMPQYPGGQIELALLVQKMQHKFAKEKQLKGKAKVVFTVAASGKVSDIKVVKKDNDGVAKGAYIIAKEMKDWKPGYQRGKAVPVKFLLPVEFK